MLGCAINKKGRVTGVAPVNVGARGQNGGQRATGPDVPRSRTCP